MRWDLAVPRLTQYPFPPYSYVSGHFPHPMRHEDGHRCPGPDECTVSPDADSWSECESYLWAVDLFNAGYYWEAHESWEAAWLAAGRVGRVADFLKGLIKLAAAGVKAREGRPVGVVRHAIRARELFSLVWGDLCRETGDCEDRSVDVAQSVKTTESSAELAERQYFGCSLQSLTAMAEKLMNEETAAELVELAKDVARRLPLSIDVRH